MRARRTLSILAGAAALALASLVVASPASAAVLPDGQRITVIHDIIADVGPGADQFFNVSPADGTSTAVGGFNDPSAVWAVDVNDDGLGYASVREFTSESTEAYLYRANAATGTLSDPVLIAGGDFELTSCEGLDLQPNGEILLACNYNEGDTNVSYIGTVTPAGLFTPFLTSGVNNVPQIDFSAIAYDAVTGQLWAFGDITNAQTLAWPVNRAAGTLGAPVELDFLVYGADFDRSGQLFITTYDESDIEDFVLATLVPATGDRTIIGAYTDGPNTLSPVWAITVWGKPALAATGSTPTDVVPIALGSALLLLAGAAFVATNRLQRRRG